MSYPGGEQRPDEYSTNLDPFTGQPVASDYGANTPGYQVAPPLEQQHTSTYQGFGAFEQPEPTKRSPIIPLAILAVVLVLGVGVTLFFVLVSGDETDNTATGSIDATATTQIEPPTSAPASSAPPSTAASSAASESDIKVDAITPGWQGVLSPKENVAYDVPKDWTVESPGMLSGFEDESGPRTIMHGISTYLDEACEDVRGSSRGKAGFMTAGDIDPDRGARAAVILWGEAAAELPEQSGEVEPSPSRDVKIAGGEITAKMSSAVVELPKDQDCPAPRLKITAVAFKPAGNGDTALFILHSDVGVKHELSDDVAKKIIASLRPHQG